MALHIIKSAKADTIPQVAELLSPEDQVLLLEDGCYLYTVAKQKLTTANKTVMALADHMQARGLSDKAQAAGIELIDFKHWVRLTHSHPQSTSW